MRPFSGVDLRDWCGCADLDAEVFAGRAQGLRDRTHPADDMPLPGLLVGVAAAQQVEQQSHGGSGLVWAAVLAVQAVRQDQALELLGFEVLIEKLAQRSGQ